MLTTATTFPEQQSNGAQAGAGQCAGTMMGLCATMMGLCGCDQVQCPPPLGENFKALKRFVQRAIYIAISSFPFRAVYIRCVD